jgi:formate hydrogenlyase subunit 3/multisubunit Na+/H+ antiporter MnhD subunit
MAKSLAFLVNGVYQHSFNAVTIHDLQQADRLTPFLSVAFAGSILSLAAIPPFPGFIGEWTFLTSVFSQGEGWSLVGAIALLAGSLVSLGYYWKLLRNLFFTPAQEKREQIAGKRSRVSIWLQVPVLVLLTLILVITVNPQGIMKWTEPAAQFLLMGKR